MLCLWMWNQLTSESVNRKCRWCFVAFLFSKYTWIGFLPDRFRYLSYLTSESMKSMHGFNSVVCVIQYWWIPLRVVIQYNLSTLDDLLTTPYSALYSKQITDSVFTDFFFILQFFFFLSYWDWQYLIRLKFSRTEHFTKSSCRQCTEHNTIDCTDSSVF